MVLASRIHTGLRWRRAREAALAAIALLAVSTALTACGGSSAATSASRHHLTLWLDWTQWGVHVPVYAAQQEGFFRTHGLDVDIRVPSDPSEPLKLAAADGDTVGLGYMSDVVTAEANGIPVESIGALVQHHLNCIMTLRSSGITSPTQLAGKVVGDGGTPADKVILNTVFKKAGVMGKVTVRSNLYPLVPALLTHRVDAIEGAYQVWEKIQIEQQGQQVNVIQLQDWGVPDEYELVLLAGRSMIQKHPTVLREFMGAMQEGVAFSVSHPRRAVNDFLAVNHEDAAGASLVRQSWRLLIPLVLKAGAPFGSQSQTRWHHLATWMFGNKLVSKLMPSNKLFTNSFLSSGASG
jgi:putative hydroxymethylpyrimidine transport system substrate-binding protein